MSDDLDSTQALLKAELPTLPRTPPVPNYPNEDDSEDEVFFGEKSTKEMHGPNAKAMANEVQESPDQMRYNRRRTLQVPQGKNWRAFEIDQEKYSSIPEEGDENSVPNNQVGSTTPRKVKSAPLVESPVPKPRKKLAVQEDANTTERIESIASDSFQFGGLSASVASIADSSIKSSASAYHVEVLDSEMDDEEDVIDDEYDDADDVESSVIDVNNDQLFDDSIFTEYNDADLSCISNTITKKLKKKIAREEKKRKKEQQVMPDIVTSVPESNRTSVVSQHNPSKSEEKILEDDDPDLIPPSPGADSSADDVNEWFNTVDAEMLLYEKFGPDYDEVVEKMTMTERRALRNELAGKKPKSAAELLGESALSGASFESDGVASEMLMDVVSPVRVDVPSAPIQSQPPAGHFKLPTPATAEVLSRARALKRPPSPNEDRFRTFKKSSPAVVHVATPIKKSPVKKRFFATPIQQRSPMKTPNYLRPTAASQMRFLSPSKDRDQVDSDQYVCPKDILSPSPTKQQQRTPLRRPMPTAIDMKNIVSPIAQYIYSNPVPPIIRHVKARNNKLDQDMLAAAAVSPAKQHVEGQEFPELPEAVYKSSRLAREEQLELDNKEKDLPKYFGQVDKVDAMVVRHVGRVRVPHSLNPETLPRSTSSSQNGKSVFRQIPPRESDAFNESMVDMSLREVKPVRKVTTLPRRV